MIRVFFKNIRNFPPLNFMLRSYPLIKHSLFVSPLILGVHHLTFSVKCQAIDVISSHNAQPKLDYFIYYFSKDLIWLGVTIISAIIIAFINICIPLYFGQLVNAINTNHQITFMEYFTLLKNPVTKLLFLYSFQALFTFSHILSLTCFGENVAANIRISLFSSLIQKDLQFYDTHKTGEIISRITTDVQEFKSSLKQCITIGIKSTTQCIGCFYSIYIISPSMTMGITLVVGSLVMIGAVIAKTLRKLSHQCREKLSLTADAVSNALGNVRTVKAFVGEEREILCYHKLVEECAECSRLLGFGIATFQALTNTALNGLLLGTLVLGGSLMLPGAGLNFGWNGSRLADLISFDGRSISAGQLMSFLVAVQTIQKSLGQLSQLTSHYVKCTTAAAKIVEYMDDEYYKFSPRSSFVKTIPWYDITSLTDGLLYPDRPRHHYNLPANVHQNSWARDGVLMDEHFRGEIRFREVHFTYPTRPNDKVLKGFDLLVEPGQIVALCGPSGSGKTTVVSLLEHFYDIDSGEIMVDGMDIRDVNTKWLRGKIIGIIDQEPLLFATSIMENIRYGKPNATDSEVVDAAKLAHAHDFITNFSDGYSTLLGERGKTLSGGEKQRIAIARAILKKPPILILDEATSAMDTESERKIKLALNDFLPGRTVIMIAHRLSTIRHVDVIVVMRNGTIAEKGSHAELMRKGGIYWNMVQGERNGYDNDLL